MKKLVLIAVVLFTISHYSQAQLFEKKNDPWYRAMQITYVSLNAADYVLTLSAISKGAYEVNPLARPIIDRPVLLAAIKGTVTGGTLFLTEKWLYKDSPKLAKGVLIGLNLAYGVVVGQNIRVNIILGR